MVKQQYTLNDVMEKLKMLENKIDNRMYVERLTEEEIRQLEAEDDGGFADPKEVERILQGK